MFDEEDRDLNLILPLVLGIAVAISIGMMLFAGIGLKGSAKPAAAAAAPVAAAAAAPATAAPAVAPATSFPARIFFATGSTTIDTEGSGVVSAVVAALAATPAAKIGVSGYVDATGNKDQNAELAKQRAFAVRDALKAAGIAEERIELRKPEEITAGVEGREARRVEISVLP